MNQLNATVLEIMIVHDQNKVFGLAMEKSMVFITVLDQTKMGGKDCLKDNFYKCREKFGQKYRLF